MEMPVPGYQEELGESVRVPPGKEGLLKGPPSSETKAVGIALTQPPEAERLGISEQILPESLLLPKHSPVLPAGLTNRTLLLPTASDTHFLAGRLLCFPLPPSHFNKGGPGAWSAPEQLAKPSDLCFAGREPPNGGEQPQLKKIFSNK